VTVRGAVIPVVSPSGKLAISSELEKEDGWRKGSEDEADAECLPSAGFFSEDHDFEK
jgi:hypothetical protein